MTLGDGGLVSTMFRHLLHPPVFEGRMDSKNGRKGEETLLSFFWAIAGRKEYLLIVFITSNENFLPLMLYNF
jgi:hypothetical protein